MKLVENKKLHLTQTVQEKFEAGVELLGHEVKTLRSKLGSLEGARVVVRGGEAFLMAAYIPPYQPKNTDKSYDPYRNRRLLFSKKELQELAAIEQTKTLTLIPNLLYSKNNLIKCEVAVCKKKDAKDKREDIRKEITKRELRAF